MEINKKSRIKEIFERVKAAEIKNGNMTFSYNVDHGTVSEYETLMDYFYYDRLGWCGCGDPEAAQKIVCHFLDAYSDFDEREEKLKKYFNVESIYDNDLLLCFAYTMDAAEFTEHGTSISGAWLTQDGKDYLYLLQTENKEEETDECIQEKLLKWNTNKGVF